MEIGMRALIAAVMFLVVIAITGWLAWDRRRTSRNARLRARPAPEYDSRLHHEAASSVFAELPRESPVNWAKHLEIRPISPEDGQRFTEAWRAAQALFLHRPLAAVAEAESLVEQAMRRRGYPVRDFEARSADIRVDHPRVVEHYREAHRLSALSREGAADAEDLRLAMVHCRALFDELVVEAFVPAEELTMAHGR